MSWSGLSASFGFWQWVALAGFAIGLLLFIQGFRVLRKYHLLADTPRSPIGSLPMGLVEVHGKARGERLVKGPVSGTECLFYRVEVRALHLHPIPFVIGAAGRAILGPAHSFFPSVGRRAWEKIFAPSGTDFGGEQFYLEDETGRTLVDARGAELDLPCTRTRSFLGGRRVGLWSLLQPKADPFAATAGNPSDFELEGYSVAVLASQPYRVHALNWLMGDSPDADLPEEWGAGRRFNVREYCVVPGRWYDVTGTCIEDPRPPDLKQRTMIVKGEHEPIFLISDKAESGLESSLFRSALVRILLGALFAVMSLGSILSRLGMF